MDAPKKNENYIADLGDFIGVEIECRECGDRASVLMEKYTDDWLGETLTKHLHPKTKSDPTGTNLATREGDLAKLRTLFLHLRGIDEIMAKRSLKLRFKIKSQGLEDT